MENNQDKIISNLKKAVKDFKESLTNFDKSYYQVATEFSSKLRLVSSEDDFFKNFDIVYQFPEEYNEEFLIMVTQGLSYKEAFELLKDTYKF